MMKSPMFPMFLCWTAEDMDGQINLKKYVDRMKKEGQNGIREVVSEKCDVETDLMTRLRS